MTWFSDRQEWNDVLALAPNTFNEFNTFFGAFQQLPHIPAETLELCRLRVAQLHLCNSAQRTELVTLAAEKKDSLANWTSVDLFTASERACLEFAELYTMDVQSLTDEQAEAVKAHFGDAGLVALVQALGMFYGTTRVRQLWDI